MLKTLPVVLLVVSCSSTAPQPTSGDLEQQVAAEMERLQAVEEPMRGSILSWFNTTGLARLTPGVWQTRLNQLCADEFWIRPELVEARSDEYLVLDGELSVRDPAAGPVPSDQLYTTVWVMALNHCRQLVPQESIAPGPPWLDS